MKVERIETISNKIQIEEYREVKDGRILLNGEKIMMKGVNRHEFDPVNARTLSEETMIKDIELMKQTQYQYAVRSSHYPNGPRWYDLCNEYGLLVLNTRQT